MMDRTALLSLFGVHTGLCVQAPSLSSLRAAVWHLLLKGALSGCLLSLLPRSISVPALLVVVVVVL